MSVWTDIQKRSLGDDIRNEDQIGNADGLYGAFSNPSWDLKDIRKKIREPFPWAELLTIDSKPYTTTSSHFTAEEEHYLKLCAAIPFKLGVFSSLENILKTLGVRVVIEPGIRYHTAPLVLMEEMLFWEKEVERLREERGPEYEDASRTLEKIREEIKGWNATPLRGEYFPPVMDADSIKEPPVIKLYPDEMHWESENYRGPVSRRPSMNDLLVSTLAHEAMHAYFDRFSRYELPYVPSAEEPMAEFGMLLFLSEAKLKRTSFWALEDTSTKKTCYRYGAGIMRQHLRETDLSGCSDTPTRRDLELYKRRLLCSYSEFSNSSLVLKRDV